jgi:hypothetical protein
MAKKASAGTVVRPEPTIKGTSIGRGTLKMSSMNKAKKRGFKAYRGQGK